MASVYEVVTNRILEQLEKGVVPWAKPWRVRTLPPRSLMANRQYRGINILLTGSQGYESPYWLTYRQAQELGAQVRRGERGTPIIFWTTLDRKDSAGATQERKVPLLRYYTVFNLAQLDGLRLSPTLLYPAAADGTVAAPIEAAERLVAGYEGRPEVRDGMARAAYSSSADAVDMPRREAFGSAEEYYSTLFHELVHSTGHGDRLNRDTLRQIERFGDHNYSQEELVAEMGSAMLCTDAGIGERVIENQAAYIARWVRKLKEDSRAVVVAAARAQKAVDWIKGVRAHALSEDGADIVAGTVVASPELGAPCAVA